MKRKDVTYFITLTVKTVANENLKYEKYLLKLKEVSQQFDYRFQDLKTHYVDIEICWQPICSQC